MGKIRCFRSSSADSIYSYVGAADDAEMKNIGWYAGLHLWQKILFIVGIVILILLLLGFLLIWVIFPLIFMNTVSLQRFFIFWNFQDPKNPEFDNPQKYGMDGIVNFYLTTRDIDNSSLLSLGLWLVIPNSEVKSTQIKSHTNESAATILQKTSSPVVLYLHGVGANRIKTKEPYEMLRKHFMVIAPDHRGYGDSSPGVPPSEEGIISDSVQIYQWIRSQTKNDIYVYGHSLGTALSTHTVRKLNEAHGIVPMGLMLEAAFTTMREEIPATWIGKLFSWLVWFEATVLAPLERNGFLFRTSSNILYVDCPIMVFHAQDDNVIPVSFGRTIVDIAKTKRTIPPQGNVTYHEFGMLGYGHVGIPTDPHIPQYINEFIGYCKDQNKRKD